LEPKTGHRFARALHLIALEWDNAPC
jgi:hypothetical protein